MNRIDINDFLKTIAGLNIEKEVFYNVTLSSDDIVSIHNQIKQICIASSQQSFRDSVLSKVDGGVSFVSTYSEMNASTDHLDLIVCGTADANALQLKRRRRTRE